MKSIFKFISSRNAAWLFTIFALACRVSSVLFSSFVHRDKLFLAVQSKSFLNGNGFVIPKYYTNSINVPIFDLTPNWPPGYPILLAPFLKIFNDDIYLATTTLDIIAGIFFVLIVRKIVTQLNFSPVAVNITTLIVGCFNYQFITQSLPTDLSSFVFFLLGLSVFLDTIQKDNLELKKILVTALLLWLPCILRYSYPPLSLSVFAAVIFVGIYKKKKDLVKKGFIGFGILLCLLFVFFLFLKTTTGDLGYIVETEKGFYPKQLLDWAPVGPGAFIDPVFVTSQLINFTGISLIQSLNILAVINAIMLLGFLFAFFYLFFIKKYFTLINSFKFFILVGFFISCSTCLSLGYLTLTYKPQAGWGNYLGELRYFMFVTLYLQIIFVGWIFLYSSWKKSLLQKIIVLALSLLMCIEIVHSIYYNIKSASNFEKIKSGDLKDPDYVFFTSMCKELISENPDAEILVASDSDEYFRLMATYLGQKGIYDGFNLLKSLPAVDKKTILILALYDNEIATYQPLLSVQNGKLIKNINHANFYRIDLLPN